MCTVSCADSQAVNWIPESGCPYSDELAVFRFLLPIDTNLDSSINQLLSSEERQRAHRYHQKDDIRRYSYTRSLLKIVCGNYISQRPSEIKFTAGEANKPELSGNTGWHINVSHSGNWILIAIGRIQVGVDIEKINPAFNVQDILAISFTAGEQDYIKANTDSQRCFYTLWTRKEALVKATGKGMDNNFGRVPSLDGLHTVADDLIGGPGSWLVRSFAVTDDYSASLAYRQIEAVPKFYTLDRAFVEKRTKQYL